MKEVEKPNLIFTEVRAYGEIKQIPILAFAGYVFDADELHLGKL